MAHPLRTFTLSESDISQYVGKQPEWKNLLAFITYKRTYARALPDGTREEYWQTLKRVVEGVFSIQKNHCKSLRLPWSDQKAKRSALEMFQQMWQFKWLPPGRGLWMMGTDYMFDHGSAALFNCYFVSTEEINTDFSGPFTFLMDRSMLGGGVGFDLKGAGKVRIRTPTVDVGKHVVVEDSREGWVAAVRTLLEGYVGKGSIPESFNCREIRAYGQPIKGFGGTSAGPEPLVQLLDSIIRKLNARVGEKITGLDILDIMNMIGKCVVAGNVRRSSEIAFGEVSDEEYLNAKNPELNPVAVQEWRWASNNSVFCTVGMDYAVPAERTAVNGEPGYIWLDACRTYGRMADPPNHKDMKVGGTNPCGEIPLESYESCNLAETFMAHHETLEEYQRSLKMAYLYCKTVTLLPTHDDKANAVILRNRRIGLSQSGIVQAIEKFGLRTYFQMCNSAYQYVVALDQSYSNWLCIPRSVKMTTVKPSGTVSIVAGATPGVHFPHSEHYIRRVRFGADDPLLKVLAEANYLIEDDYYSTGAKVVAFPVKEEHFYRGKNDVTIWEQMELVANMQYWWADNAVSCTVTFDKSEAEDLARVLSIYETRLKTISFLPRSDHGYKQAPYEEISAEQYESMVGGLGEVVWVKVETKHEEQRGCDGETCVI